MAAPTVRPVSDDELAAFARVQRVAMHMKPATDEELEIRRETYALDRCLVGVDEAGAIVGSARSFATRLRTPGGEVPAAAVSAVGVLPTHRRRGHLHRMMHTQLADVADRGEAVAILVAAEWPIYGRYGYGMAIEACKVRVDTEVARLARSEPTGSTAIVEPKEVLDAIAAVYPRVWERNAGHMTWDPWRWEAAASVRDLLDGDDEERRQAVRVVWRDDDGAVQGLAIYNVKDGTWPDMRPAAELTVGNLYAATDEAERELWRFLLAVDWVTTIRARLRPIDDPLPLRLVDGRTAVLEDRFDQIWLRVVDVPAALTARRYATAGGLVLEVVDPGGFAQGRFALDAGPDGADCSPTGASPDLVVPATSLGAAYLGGTSWARLAAAGGVDEETPGAVARAAALFGTPRAPWCSTMF